ncbi:hypothetical protein K2Y11_22795 [bacterium]|nr:hypothetical protein [bacterium]
MSSSKSPEPTVPPLPANGSVSPDVSLEPRVSFLTRLVVTGIVGLPIGLIILVFTLAQIEPSFYSKRLGTDDESKRHQCSNQFLNGASRLINDLQNSPAWEANFNEDQINGWLAEDFQQNHANKVLPPGVTDPRVEIDGDRVLLGFRCHMGLFSTVVQIGVRAWVPKRNLLAFELDTAQAGLLPLPTTYTRKVIEQFILAQNLEINWKRNGNKLVALVDFQRAERQIVLRRVEIREDGLYLEGLSGRHGIPATDYAPSAN